ncbi:MAG: site-specific integrase [Acidobacteria bacterium]|nr:site-specific integrase [Acidobacteriota bacterium]
MTTTSVPASLPAAPLIQAFFVEYLLNQKNASPRTVAAYRDAFRLLLRYLHQTKGVQPVALRVADLDAPVILAFLDNIEQQRANCIRSRNARLAAIRSFFRFVQMREPAGLAVASRVLAIPVKRTERKLVGYLTRSEIDAILATADQTHWDGRRDHALLLTLYNSGARVSEIIGVRRDDIALDAPASLKLHGKGRKERAVPLWAKTAKVLRAWLQEPGDGLSDLAFPSARGRRISRHGVSYLLNRAAGRAAPACPSIRAKRVSPHLIRHSTAMHLLQAGVDPAVIALWLGHESVETTHGYVEADLTMTENALGKLTPAGSAPGRFKPADKLLAFLEAL